MSAITGSASDGQRVANAFTLGIRQPPILTASFISSSDRAGALTINRLMTPEKIPTT